MNFNPYLVLNVPHGADFDALRTAYRRLARENHPDIALDKIAATERMAQINRAWAILGDQTKRATFDSQWQLHLIEQARHEAQRQEIAKREAASREKLRQQTQRARSARENSQPTKSGQSAARSTKNASRSAPLISRGASKARSKSAGNASARSNSSKSARQTASSRATSSRDGESRTGRTFAEETSPRALRLMRKVTLAARVWQRDGNARAAIETCRSVLLADNRNVAARELLAEIYAIQGRHELAITMLDQAIQIAPDDRFLRNKRQRLEIARAPVQAPRAKTRPTFWQRLRARLGAKIG